MNHPLTWPSTWPRRPARERRRASFRDATVARACDEVLEELRLLGVTKPAVISTNLALRVDGLPRSGQGQPPDPGAAVYFELKGARRVLACDRWDRVEDNLRAIAKHIGAMRGMTRWGVGTTEQAFTGYAALPERAGHGFEGDPFDLLELERGRATEDDVRQAFRERAKADHPDHGGSEDAFHRLCRAKDAALQELRHR
jgi:hypothetical protein